MNAVSRLSRRRSRSRFSFPFCSRYSNSDPRWSGGWRRMPRRSRPPATRASSAVTLRSSVNFSTRSSAPRASTLKASASMWHRRAWAGASRSACQFRPRTPSASRFCFPPPCLFGQARSRVARSIDEMDPRRSGNGHGPHTRDRPSPTCRTRRRSSARSVARRGRAGPGGRRSGRSRRGQRPGRRGAREFRHAETGGGRGRRGCGRSRIPFGSGVRRPHWRALRPADGAHRGARAGAHANIRCPRAPSGYGDRRSVGELAAMKRRTAAAIFAIFAVWSTPALAWDPFREDIPDISEPDRELDPAPFIAPPPGLYYVTDTYVADVVTSSGPLTTYSTSTVHESTGSYARVLDTVGTGASSAFDGTAFNGRRALGDGRSVAGTYYQNYVLIGGGFVPVSVVFFQDDAELARLRAAATPSPAVGTQPRSTPPPTARSTTPACCPAARSVATPAPTPAPARPIRPGLSVLPVSAPLSSLEVLRGRAVALWPRAFVDDREIPVLSWTLIAGDAGEALAIAASGGAPF